MNSVLLHCFGLFLCVTTYIFHFFHSLLSSLFNDSGGSFLTFCYFLCRFDTFFNRVNVTLLLSVTVVPSVRHILGERLALTLLPVPSNL